MFDNLSDKLNSIFDGLTKRGALSKKDVENALREVRIALLEADVALDVVKKFIESVKQRAIGEEVIRSVTPGQMVIKIVHDYLTEMLGGAGEDLTSQLENTGVNLTGVPPVVILMVGLQGSGKTTTSAKLGLRIQKRDKKKILMASLDVFRPAAQQQLELLGQQSQLPTLPVVIGEQPKAIAVRAMDAARREGYDVVILDTAGRLHIDQELMDEVATVKSITSPVETLLVADAMTGQDSVNMAKEFNERVGVTGIVLTRVDGDARGGAALSMLAVTGKPIKLMGVGEKLDDLEVFQPSRIAGRILGQGDIVGLVEKASEVIEKEDAEKLARKMIKGQFSLNDMANQLEQLSSMGDIGSLMGMIPGFSKMKNKLSHANVDDKMISHQQAILSSMTPLERERPKVLNGSRRRRIAAGSGTSVQDVNRLLKQHKQMGIMMKKMGKKGFMGGDVPPGFLPPKGML